MKINVLTTKWYLNQIFNKKKSVYTWMNYTTRDKHDFISRLFFFLILNEMNSSKKCFNSFIETSSNFNDKNIKKLINNVYLKNIWKDKIYIDL